MTDTLSRPVGLAAEGPTPPQALEAERSVLAAMLLDPEAVGKAIEMMDTSDFYRVAHQRIYDAILALFNRSEKADLITLAEELRKRGELEAVGGPAAISQVLEYATTSANLEQHIRIIRSKAVLRQLIRASNEIQQECFVAGEETGAILDRAEQRIFEITDSRVRQGFVALKDLLKPAFEHIQQLYERKVHVTGVPSGYDDLDKLTAGFQKADLVIIAGRPSMGKTSLAINIAENAAIRDRIPVAIFSLEMSKEQLVLRMLCSQSEVALHKVRNGFLGQEDWPRLTTGAGLLTQAPIVIDDSAALSVLEVRAKCRRLKSEGKLGLVVLDYLQLMRATGQPENRVQEISQITRGLKALAKELNVPVIALSQLSRAVETRGGSGRPQLSDLRESGCLTADTRILRADTGAEVSLGGLLLKEERDIPVWTLDDQMRMVRGTMTHVFPSGAKQVFEMRLASGRKVKASANHPFLTLDGWKALDHLREGDRLAVPRMIPEPERTQPWPEAEPKRQRLAARGLAAGLGTAYCGSTLYKHAPSRERLSTVAALLEEPRLHQLAGSDVRWDTIVAIEPCGEEPVFDATVLGTHNFIANGIVAHNSIEQDADVVLFVYREEKYKPDDPSLKGKADFIIAKQRNGPTGDVEMTFLHEFTKFVPYSPLMPGEAEPSF